MVLARTGGPTCAVLRDVDLAHRVERGGTVTSEQAGQPGREAGADDDAQTAPAGFAVEREQRGHVFDAVAHRDDVAAPIEMGPREIDVITDRRGEHCDGDPLTVGLRPGERDRPLAEGSADLRQPGRVVVEDEDRVDVGARHELTRGTRADRPRTR